MFIAIYINLSIYSPNICWIHLNTYTLLDVRGSNSSEKCKTKEPGEKELCINWNCGLVKGTVTNIWSHTWIWKFNNYKEWMHESMGGINDPLRKSKEDISRELVS